MPLPKPGKNEEKDKFIDRCMGDDTMNREFPEAPQRRAVCERQWDGKEESRVLSRAFNFAASRLWAVEENHLRLILDIAQRAQHPDFLAVAQRRAERISSDGAVRHYGSVALVDVIGPIFRYANMFTRISGATSIDSLALALRSVVDDRDVSAIILNIDSPGGEVSGISEMGSAIVAAQRVKPIVAYVDDMGASGAYWLASAAASIVASDTAKLGSIGVIAVISERAEEEEGVKTYRFVSSVSPDKIPDLETEKGRNAIQQVVDDLGMVFLRSVAQNRGVSMDHAASKFGAGKLLVAARALDVGMIDELGTLDELIDRTKAGNVPSKRSRAAVSAAHVSTKEIDKMQTDEVKTDAGQPPVAGVPAEQPKAEAPKVEEKPDARKEALAYAAEVVDLCALAGLPQKAVGFIRAEASIGDVRKDLLAARAAADSATEIHSQVPLESISDSARGAQTVNLKDSPLVRAAEHEAERHAKARKEN